MLSRAAGALLTGPLAFFVSGVIDVALALWLGLRWLARRAISRRT
jgi:hypothetical protein